ncbi:MAG: Dna2/Cas4 domain-containing protein [Proteobacteria bacterium]|nr:Dna2/Cas4 domain-containing protein [Pseudomonadota bacterium]
MSETLLLLVTNASNFDLEEILLCVLLLAFLLVLEFFIRSLETKRVESGLSKRASAVSVDGGHTHAVREYISDIQGLAGRPDAVISEHGYLIPVERKPLARKLRDRYVAQLLVYMRLIEEFEGKRPPYGYLILGPKCRKVKILNSPERQAWLQNILDDMRGILEGAAAVPSPQPTKCEKCDVREFCSAFAATADSTAVPVAVNSELVQIAGRPSSPR